MVTELLNAMRLYKENHGEDLKVIKLTRSQYNELRLELQGNLRYQSEVADFTGKDEMFNGARIEVV